MLLIDPLTYDSKKIALPLEFFFTSSMYLLFSLIKKQSNVLVQICFFVLFCFEVMLHFKLFLRYKSHKIQCMYLNCTVQFHDLNIVYLRVMTTQINIENIFITPKIALIPPFQLVCFSPEATSF